MLVTEFPILTKTMMLFLFSFKLFITKDEHDVQLPMRYAVKNRPINSRFSAFDFASLNKTIYPGWDYAGPNSYSCSVLLLLYFIPEIRNVMLHSQLQNFVSVALGKKVGKIADGEINASTVTQYLLLIVIFNLFLTLITLSCFC
jgi:hypothetical protein